MKKVLIAFDGSQFSEGAIQFAVELNSRQPVLLTSVFIPQVSYANLWGYPSGMAGVNYIPLLEEEDNEIIQENIARFENLCREKNISYRVHKDFFDFALPELKKETRFADLLIISSEKFFENMIGEDSGSYMRDALQQSECPVIVVPEKFQFPERNILTYDGSESSVYVIKMFTYLLPELCDNETLLAFSKEEDDPEVPNAENIEELASQHFTNLSLLKLHINPGKHFTNWVKENNNAIVVCGSYSRSLLSLLFKKSFIASTIAEHKLPVFIAHH